MSDNRYFDGDTPDRDRIRYDWQDDPHDSESTEAYHPVPPTRGGQFDGNTPDPVGKPLSFRWAGWPNASATDLVYTYTASPAMLDRITVEVLLPNVGNEVFILNESLLDGWRLGDRDQAHQWVPIEAQARRIETHRGGTLLDIASTMEVGTLTVQLVNPPQVRIRPSTPIRVRTDAGTVLFTGHVENQVTRYQRSSLTDGYTLVLITAVDAVHTLANTMRYGAVVETTTADETPFDYETFEARADRLIRRTGLPYQIAPNEPMQITEEVWARDINVTPDADTLNTLWTGHGGVNIFAAGAAGNRRTAWGRFTLGTYPAGTGYITTPIHNLRPGVTYTISASVHGQNGLEFFAVGLGIVGIGYNANTPPNNDVAFSFVATATTHDVMLTNAEAITVEDLGVTLPTDIRTFPGDVLNRPFTLTLTEQRMPRGQQWFCQSIVYESNLVNHLDMCVNTVRGRWWVDRHGVVHFAREEGTVAPLLEFSDTPGAGLISYVDVESAEDTARIVNDVTLQNNGRAVDETGTAMASNTTITAQDVTSVATNGPRGAQVPTSIYDPPFPELAHYGAGAELAKSYTTAYAMSEERISGLRVHVTPNLTEPMAALDVYDPIDATYQDATTQARVMSITHTITPEHWHTNLTLVER